MMPKEEAWAKIEIMLLIKIRYIKSAVYYGSKLEPWPDVTPHLVIQNLKEDTEDLYSLRKFNLSKMLSE